MSDLSRLEAIVDQLLHEAIQIDRQRKEAKYPLFDEQLFHCRSKLLTPCVKEIQHEISALRQERQAGKLLASRTQYICESIVAQIQAVQREIATQNIRKNEPRKKAGWRKPINELRQDLAKHKEWESRLAAMVRDKEMQLSRSATFAEQQSMQKEVLALEGRLTRCRSSLANIEKSISYSERGR